MKAQFKVNKNLILELEGSTQKELFKELASAVEVFGEKKCGLCGCEDITHVYRTVTSGKKTYEYPEYHCTNKDCRARLSLGTMQEGGVLFPIRKLVKEGPEQGKPSREEGVFDFKGMGWTKFKGKKEEEKEE